MHLPLACVIAHSTLQNRDYRDQSIKVNRKAFEVCEPAMTQRPFMGSAQSNPRRMPGLQRLLPPRRAQTPAVTGFQPRKAEFRHRRGEIVATGCRVVEEARGHYGAHRVTTDVFRMGVAAPVAKKTR